MADNVWYVIDNTIVNTDLTNETSIYNVRSVKLYPHIIKNVTNHLYVLKEDPC